MDCCFRLLAKEQNVPDKTSTLRGGVLHKSPHQSIARHGMHHQSPFISGFSSKRFQVSSEAVGDVDTEDLAYDCYVLQIGSAQTSLGRDVDFG